MKNWGTFIFGAYLLLVCFLVGCRTTEGQIYYAGGPVQVKPYSPYTALAPEIEAPSTPPAAVGSKIPFLLLTVIILITLIMIFAADTKPKRKKATAKPRKKRRRSVKKSPSPEQ